MFDNQSYVDEVKLLPYCLCLFFYEFMLLAERNIKNRQRNNESSKNCMRLHGETRFPLFVQNQENHL